MLQLLLQKIIQNGNPDGFTQPLLGTPKRYVVAFTHNNKINFDTLAGQVTGALIGYSQINIGGWTDKETNTAYIDISTSFEDFNEAVKFADEFKQIAIWDNLEMREININHLINK